MFKDTKEAFPPALHPLIDELQKHAYQMMGPPFTVEYKIFDDGDYRIEVKHSLPQDAEADMEVINYTPDSSLIYYTKEELNDYGNYTAVEGRVLDHYAPPVRRVFDGAEPTDDSPGRRPNPTGDDDHII